MAGKIVNKMMGFLGLEDDIDEELEEVEDDEEKEVELFSTNGRNTGKVVSIHTSTSTKVLIVKPVTYEEVTDICDEVKNRKIVVINITEMEPKTAQRFLDFMGGASYALGGDLQEVEKGVYILSPSNVEVSNELKKALSGKSLFDWK